MDLPETDVAKVRGWIGEENERTGEYADRLRIEMHLGPGAITILECRPPWPEGGGTNVDWTRTEVAQLRHTRSTGMWTLHRPDHHGRFHRYEDLDAAPSVDQLLAEIDADPRFIFWG